MAVATAPSMDTVRHTLMTHELSPGSRSVYYRYLVRDLGFTPSQYPDIAALFALHGWTIVDDRINAFRAGMERKTPPPAVCYADALRQPLPNPPVYSANLLDWMSLIPREASRYASATFPYEDALQEGVLGLARALEEYRPDHGPWVRYASHQIRHAIQRAAAQSGRIIRIPHGVLEMISRIEQARWQLIAALGHEPSSAELAEALDLPQAKIEATLEWMDPLSLDAPVHASAEDDGFLLGDSVRSADDVESHVPDWDIATPQEALTYLLDHGYPLAVIAQQAGQSIEALAQLVS